MQRQNRAKAYLLLNIVCLLLNRSLDGFFSKTRSREGVRQALKTGHDMEDGEPNKRVPRRGTTPTQDDLLCCNKDRKFAKCFSRHKANELAGISIIDSENMTSDSGSN